MLRGLNKSKNTYRKGVNVNLTESRFKELKKEIKHLSED